MTDAHGGPFTGHDLDRLTSLVVATWSAGRDRDWSRPAGTVAWTCTRWRPASATDDPWGDLLAGAGRARVS